MLIDELEESFSKGNVKEFSLFLLPKCINFETNYQYLRNYVNAMINVYLT